MRTYKKKKYGENSRYTHPGKTLMYFGFYTRAISNKSFWQTFEISIFY